MSLKNPVTPPGIDPGTVRYIIVFNKRSKYDIFVNYTVVGSARIT